MIAPSTRKAYERALRNFHEFIINQRRFYAAIVPQSTIAAYVAHLLLNCKLKARNVKSRLAGIHALLKMVDITFDHSAAVVSQLLKGALK